jgi:cobalt-zinc-cadmium resistance protein CzcA
MINTIIAFSIRHKLIVGLFTLALIVAGVYSLGKVPIDAVPDITNNQVQVITQAPNLGTQEIEQFISYPVELEMANLPGVLEIRSVSRSGLSAVTVVFEEDMGPYLPRQLVSEKLSILKDEIPKGFGSPYPGPITTGLGEVYQYTLKVDSAHQNKYNATQLRSIQDWIVRRQMAMVPGVVEVNSFGGFIKQYEVAVNPSQLAALDISLAQILAALEANNENTGGAYIEKSHMAHFIRGEGLAKSVTDIEQITVALRNGTPILIKDVGKVQIGAAIRYGAVTANGEGETVGGLVMMLKGANSNEVIKAIKTRVAEIQKSLPEGVYIEPYLDRSQLIERTTSTVRNNLIEGALIVIFVLVILLGNWRGGLIVASTIPLSLLFAFILMYVFDVWANLMSLGAIDFGIIVDGAVIIVEGTVFRISQQLKKGQIMNSALRDDLAEKSSSKMMRSAFFGQLIILIVFIPILGLEGIEGKMFRPMALTFMFAMIGVMLLCLTYVPMMSAWFLRVKPNSKKTWGDRFIIWLEQRYERTLQRAFRAKRIVLASALALLAVAVFTFTQMGGEFIPQLDEGTIAFHTILRPGSSLSEAVAATTKVEKKLQKEFPEITAVISRTGVSEVPTDLMPMDMADCFITLKPEDEWVSASSKPELIEKIKASLDQITGLSFEFTQPIEMRFNELMTGIREDVAVKLYGEDLDILKQKANEISQLIAGINGIGDLRVEATDGLPQISVDYNRASLARYGVSVSSLNEAIKTAFAGAKAGVIFEGEKRYDLVVRLQKEERTSMAQVQDLLVQLPNGSHLPLSELASISYQPGPMQISRDNTNRRIYVGLNVRGRDVQSLVEEIKNTLETQLELPAGYYLRYGGAFENLERATQRLKILVPLALGLIFILIFFALNSLKQSLMIYIAIPLSAIGGVFSLWLRDMPFSISAGVGFIVLFGVAVLNGLVLISSWNEIKEEDPDLPLLERIKRGAKQRVRPIMLTALTDILGFLPMAISTSAGAEVQQPLATVVIGGMLSATLLTLLVLPLLYHWLETRASLKLQPAAAVLAVLLFLLPLGDTAAQSNTDTLPQLSLEQAVNRALEKYPQVKWQELEIEKQQALKKTAWNLGTTTIFTAGEEINNTAGVYTPIGVNQQNMNVFGVAPKLALQKKEVALAQSALSLTKAQLRLAVQLSYSKLYASYQQLKVYESLDSAYQNFEEAARLRLENEASSRLEYLAAKNAAGLVQNKRSQALSNYEQALQGFNLWLLSDTVFLPQLNRLPLSATPTLANESALQAHPAMTVNHRQKEVAQSQLNVQRWAYLPKLNVQYGPQVISGQRGFYQFQAGLSIPLIFPEQLGETQAQKIRVQQALEMEKERSLEFNLAATRAQQNYTKWRQAWQYYENEALALAKEQRQGALFAFKEGAIDYLSFIQNTQNAMQLELAAWQTFEAYLNAHYQLQYFLAP